LQPKKIAELLRTLAEDKNAEEKSIAMHLIDEMKQRKTPAFHIEGLAEGKWVLLDFGPVIAHIFYHETREFYGLERLWGEAKKI
jgi:ribosome-associated protein